MKTKEEILAENDIAICFTDDINLKIKSSMDKYASQFNQEWISVKDRLPEHGIRVRGLVKVSLTEYREKHCQVSEFILMAICFWQPIVLPAATQQ